MTVEDRIVAEADEEEEEAAAAVVVRMHIRMNVVSTET